MQELFNLYEEEIEFLRFVQFFFSRQWKALKLHAQVKGIKIFGDVPIYTDFNSADVWAHPEWFKLDKNRRMLSVAGVPPDYFNEKGQHWGMPLYDWNALAESGYDWWLKRIEKNMEWFDLLRLDHFRGFSAYWEIPAEAESAVEGYWSPGPGKKLFEKIRDQFPSMPFVAEDLGMIDQEVHDLRDADHLPGMQVIQFGFGSDMPFSEHNPMNMDDHSIAYTGTHDNNTITGWFRKETDKEMRKRLNKYVGKKLHKKNVHFEMIRLVYSSPSNLVVIPIQDWLGLNENSRMNFPSTTKGNWKWKLKELPKDPQIVEKIREFVSVYGRY